MRRTRMMRNLRGLIEGCGWQNDLSECVVVVCGQRSVDIVWMLKYLYHCVQSKFMSNSIRQDGRNL